MPIFIALLFGTFALGSVVSTTISLQQLVAEGARASVAGLSDAERNSLARSFIAASVPAYPNLDASHLVVSTGVSGGSPAIFTVTATYDMSHSIAYALAGLVPLPPPTITRTATVTNGGY